MEASEEDLVHREGGIFVTQQIAEVQYDRRTFLKASLRDLLIYSVFFTCLCIAAFGSVNTPMYYYTYVVKKLFSETKFTTSDGRSIDMKQINTMEDCWTYLSEIVAKSANWNFWYKSYDKISKTFQNEDKNILYDNRVIGLPRLRQVRVTNKSCTIPSEFKPIFTHCYGYYSSGNEETNPLRVIREGVDPDDTAWIYSSAKKLGTYSFSGYVATYGGGGYYRDFIVDAHTDSSHIDLLKSDRWINRATRAIFFDFTTYNGNINVFCFIKLIFEFPPTGGVLPSSHFNTLKLIRYHAAIGKVILVCEIIVALFIIYFLFEEIIEIFAMKNEYFSSWWTLLDITILVLLVAFIFLVILRVLLVNRILKSLIRKDMFTSFDELILIQNAFHYVTAILVFFAMLKFLRFLKMNVIMNRLMTIIGEASSALIGFAVVFFIIIFSFAFLGHVLFGTTVYAFNSFSESYFSMHLILLGGIDFQELQETNRSIGPIFICVYLFSVFCVLMNMFLAILNERFWAKNKQIYLDIEEFTLSKLLKRGFQTFLNKFGFTGMVHHWLEREEDRRGTSRLKKLRRALARSGFSDAEITEFFDRYDIDEETLAGENADELIAKLKSDLEGIGSFDSTVQDRIMSRIDGIEARLDSMLSKVNVINLRLRL